jgi:superfamily I DNA and/or RNA helicase
VDVTEGRESGRYLRRSEAFLLADRVDALLRETTQSVWTIGVIAFYRQQVALLEKLKQERAWGDRVQVGTVDAFQGREFDAVFLSCVRSNKNGSVGFLALSNRLNVAMSRARRVLAVFGDGATIQKVPALKNYIEVAKKEGYHDCA